MLKRLRYVSRQVEPMTQSEVDELVERAAAANARREITGALVVAGPVFFQILEGPNESIDETFARICRDPRHTDVVCLDTQTDREIRLFPHWSMRQAGLEPTPASSRMKTLVQELTHADAERRATLTEEVASLIRAALRRAA